MAIRTQNPYESSFENLTTNAVGAVKKVQKASGVAVGNILTDAKQQLVGETGEPQIEQIAGGTQVSAGQQQQISQDQDKLLEETKKNLEKINAEIKQVRETRVKREEEKKKAEQQQAQQKKDIEEKKKKEDPVWKKMLKGKMGSKEAVQRTGG